MLHLNIAPPERLTRRVNEIRRTFDHPDVNAIAARLPVVRHRVPLRAFWARQPVDPARMFTHSRAEFARIAPIARERASSMARSATAQTLVAAKAATARTSTAATSTVSRAPRSRWFWLLAALGMGAATMYYADPQAGKRRRARVRDKLAHMKSVVTRKVPRAAERRGRFLRGKFEGVRHDVQELAAVGVHRAIPDNETLVARVRSEVLRRAHVSAGEVHVDAYEGCVTLRGQLESDAMIERLVDETRRVDGVEEVRSYLHLPGTLPPNKAQSYESATNGAVPVHLAR